MGVVVSLDGERDKRPSLDELHTLIADDLKAVNEEIVNLDERLDEVLEKNEKDFLMAYRFHMLKV